MNNIDETQIIERNNNQFHRLLFIAPIAFIITAKSSYNNFKTGENIRIGIAVLLLLFCIMLIVFFMNAIRQSRDKSNALEINEEGIIDNISWVKAGLIKWNNIERFEILKTSGHPHLFIFVKEAEKYIRPLNGMKKGVVNQIFKDKGSPIAIDLRKVKIKANELLNSLERRKNS